MERINTYAVYVLGKVLDSCFLSARMPIQNNVNAWSTARTVLDLLLRGTATGPSFRLNESRPAAIQLRDIVAEILELHQQDPEFILSDGQVSGFNLAWGQFEAAVQLDLGRAPIYFVTPKGIFATEMLIDAAQLALSKDVFSQISKPAREDVNQAGRCLAFGIWTASGYHGLRATEKILRDWYDLVLKKPTDELRMKQAIDELRKAQADAKTLAVFDQLRDLHRNPIDHPDIFLTETEAMELFSICVCAISAAARQIQAIKTAAAAKVAATTSTDAL